MAVTAIIPTHNAAAAPQAPASEATVHVSKYTSMLDSLKVDVVQSLPGISPAASEAFIKAVEAETAATAAEKQAHAVASARGTTDKEAAEKALADAGLVSASAQANAVQVSGTMLAELHPFLASDQLDPTLVKAAVLTSATPRGLAEFATQGKDHEALIDKLLGDDALMKEMLIAGGAKGGNYGPAMHIYTAIQDASTQAGDGLFQRLALATALEHAVPIKQNNAPVDTTAPETIDPVKRYLHYEKSCLDGELDPAFKNLSVWELRMVVNCDSPDRILAWGREMLRNYRPDHRRNPNPGWNYSILIKTDVLYGSQNVKDDLPSLQQYQNIIRNGGVCGRRAFIARFLLRAHGIPVWGVTQKGHAAVGRWTPNGWVVNLGAAFRWSWWDKDEAPRSGADFLLETQAREAPQEFLKVLRAQWINLILGEPAYNDRKSVVGGFWSAAAQYQARAIAAAINAKELATVGEDIAESNESSEAIAIEAARVTDEEKKITISRDGDITIPAVALTTAANPGSFIPMVCASGGKQVHCSRDLKSEQHFEYTFDAPQAGTYALTAKVVTVQADQKFLLKVTDTDQPVEIALPYTIGHWEVSRPVTVSLLQGSNTLRFTRPAPSRGVTIKHFMLTPAK